MSKNYIILTLIAIAGATALLFLPERDIPNELDPNVLLMEITDPSRYLDVDLIAQRIIEKDPSLLLIDVRAADQYSAYALPGSFNIPLEKILESENEDYLNRDDLDVVLYSNGDLYADQAWILCARLGYKNLYVLKGGLNQWFATIMQPQMPPATAPSEDFDQYTFRLAASQYFKGGTSVETNMNGKQENMIIKKRRVKKTVTAGGC
jgi:rhodanese-related sulfurtransferase